MTSATKKIHHYGKELLHELKHKHHTELPPVNGRAEKHKRLLKHIKKQEVDIVVQKNLATHYLNGQNKNGVQSQEKNHQKQENVIYHLKLLKVYQRKNMHKRQLRNVKTKLVENNLVNNQKA